MTPAEKPRAAERKRVFVVRAKSASALPMPVARPAKSVSAKAIATGDHSMGAVIVSA